MTLPQYQVQLLSPYTADVLAIFDSAFFYDIRYSRVLNDVGALAFTLPWRADFPNIFVLDAFLEVQRANPLTGALAREDTYLCRLTHRYRDESEERYVVGALSLNHLLQRRIIDPDDDPLQAGGYSTKAGAADTVMREYAMEQIGPSASADRRMPGLSISSVAGLATNCGARLRHEVLLNVLQDFSVRGETDFQINRQTGTALELFVGTMGTNKSQTANYPGGAFVMLNPARGNLRNPSLKFDRKEERNFCYALGQGQGEKRIVIKVIGDGTGDSPYNRIEFTQDIRNVEKGDALGIYTAAQAALWNAKPKIEFEFEPSESAPGNQYRFDWDLGDIVTVAWENQRQDLRIAGVELNITSTGEDIKITLEPPH